MAQAPRKYKPSPPLNLGINRSLKLDTYFQTKGWVYENQIGPFTFNQDGSICEVNLNKLIKPAGTFHLEKINEFVFKDMCTKFIDESVYEVEQHKIHCFLQETIYEVLSIEQYNKFQVLFRFDNKVVFEWFGDQGGYVTLK